MSEFNILKYDNNKLIVANAVEVTALKGKEFQLAIVFVKAAGEPQTAEGLALKSDGTFDAEEVPKVFSAMIKSIRGDEQLGTVLKLHQYFGFESGLYHGYSEKNSDMPGHPEEDQTTKRRSTRESRKDAVDKAINEASKRIAEKDAAAAERIRQTPLARSVVRLRGSNPTSPVEPS